MERSPMLYARLAGIFYLAIIVLGIFGEVFVRGALVVSGDAAATLDAISTSQLLWRGGIAGDLMMHVFDLPVIVAFYLLLKPIGKGIALLATFLNLIQTAVLVANKLNLLVPLFVLGDASYLKAFAPEQLQALSQLAIKMHGYGFAIGLIFFGFACLVRGYLLFRSGYFPRIFGILMAFAGLSYLVNSFAMLLAPALAAALFPAVLAPAFVGELALSLWLIFKGVNLAQWQQIALPTRSPSASG
jgi:Domain of unknown function (DUF4386)